MRRLLALNAALLLSCATPGAVPKESTPPPQPISGTVTVRGNPAPKAQVTVLKHRPALGAIAPCACENHPEHPLASCTAPESTEKLAALARTEPAGAPVAEVTSGADGSFTTPPLTDGKYDVRAEAPGALGWTPSVAPGATGIEVPLRPLSKVIGQVRSADGKPAAGAEVVVSAGEVREVRGAVADSNGTFEVPGVPLGPQLAIASHTGHSAAKAAPSPAATPEGALAFAPVGLQLRPRVTLRGTVTRGGAPAAGVDVQAHSDCHTYRAKTDASGKFELANLPGRDYPVSAVSGFEGVQVLAPLDAPGPLALELRKGGVLAGQVKNARGPLAGAEVVAVPRQPRGAEEIRRAHTGKDGRFELGPMPAGKWRVEVAAIGHLARPPAEVRVAEGARQPLEVELTPATLIAGFVLNDTADGLVDAEVEAVRLDATGPDCAGCRLTVRTGPDGAFELYPLAVGEYTVRARHDRYLPAELVNVKPTDQLRLTLQPGSSLFGTVRDPDQPGAISAAVSLLAAGGSVVRPPRPIDSNGTFRLEGLAGGEYTVVVESGDPLPRRVETPATIQPPASSTVDLTLPPGGPVAGRVVDDAKKPVAGATVYIAAEDDLAMAVVPSGADGSFEVKRAREGKYNLRATREGHLAGPKSTADAEAGPRKYTMVLPRLPAVKGRVRFPAGSPAADTVWVNGEPQKLDARGGFRATLLRPGKQPVVIEARGLPAAVVSADAAVGRETDLKEVAFAQGRAIEGHVLDPDGKPLARAAVLAADPRGKDALRDRLYGAPEGNPPLAPVLTDASGKFRVEHAPAGSAALLIRHARHRQGEATVAADQASATVTLQAGGVVGGKVLDETGDPVRGTVTLVPADERGTVLSGNVSEDGRFGFGGLPPGRYAVSVSALPNVDGSLMVFDPAQAEVREREVAQLELRPRASGARVTVRLRLPEALGALSARLLPADALDAPAQSLYRRLFLAMPAEPSLANAPTFRHAPQGPQTLVLLRELGPGQLGLDRRRIEVPASGELSVLVESVRLETVLRDEGG